MKLTRLLRNLFDPAQAASRTSGASYAAFEAGPLCARRLEDRRVLAADPLADGLPQNDNSASGHDNGEGAIQTMTVPVISMPGNQSTSENVPLDFSAATNRLIRIDDPDIGAGPFTVHVSAYELQGLVRPYLSFGTTAGLTVSGNGVDLFTFEGSLGAVNAALSQVTFVGADDGEFALSITAIDENTNESDSAAVFIEVTNADPHIQLANALGAQEGTQIKIHAEAFDPGPLDTVQTSWAVNYRGTPVAQGVGDVEFFAPTDGDYDLTITATDGDGGIATLHDRIAVGNVSPSLELAGAIRDGVTYMTIVITDPGIELFTVEIFWSQASETSQTIVTTDRVLVVPHEYDPAELEFDGDLTVAVQVSDNLGIARETFTFVDIVPEENSRPSIEPLLHVPPPDRAPHLPPQFGSTPPQLPGPDAALGATSGKQEHAAIHQFVLRVVGANGEESGNYPLPPEALADLPAFLASMDVPDGHYRVYVVTGDLERLVIDGHLRAGRIIDPGDESQTAFDLPPMSEQPVAVPIGPQAGAVIETDYRHAPMLAAAQAAISAELLAIGVDEHAGQPGEQAESNLTAVQFVALDQTAMGLSSIATESQDAGAPASYDGDNSLLVTFAAGGTIAMAAAVAYRNNIAEVLHRHTTETRSHRFDKQARLARRLARAGNQSNAPPPAGSSHVRHASLGA